MENQEKLMKDPNTKWETLAKDLATSVLNIKQFLLEIKNEEDYEYYKEFADKLFLQSLEEDWFLLKEGKLLKYLNFYLVTEKDIERLGLINIDQARKILHTP